MFEGGLWCALHCIDDEQRIRGYRDEADVDVLVEQRRVLELQLLECASRKHIDDSKAHIKQLTTSLLEARGKINDLAKEVRTVKASTQWYSRVSSCTGRPHLCWCDINFHCLPVSCVRIIAVVIGMMHVWVLSSCTCVYMYE